MRSFFVQDEWCATEKATVTLGVRYDDYDDIGTNTSPRIATVYEISPTHLLKAQYAQAFRPPNYLELYMENNPFEQGDENLKAEMVDTYEAAYIYNNQEEIVRIGIFRSLLQNLIGLKKQNDFFGNYTDKGAALVQGAEAEFEKRYFDDMTVRAHLSYVDAKNEADTINRYAALIGSAGLSKRLYKNFGAALLYRYTGERQRQKYDSREEMEAEHRFDLTLFNDHTGGKNFNIKAGIKNLLDAPAAYPAPTETYEEDYPKAGRNYWLKAEYRF
jgi:iron complex outermembrane receptor protein